MPSLNWTDVATLFISVFALIVSAGVAYFTLFQRFKPQIEIDHRLYIFMWDGSIIFGLKFVVINLGAQGGLITNLRAEVSDQRINYGNIFHPHYQSEEFGVNQQIEQYNLDSFSAIVIKGKDLQEKFVFFRPNSSAYTLCEGKISLSIRYSTNQKSEFTRVDDILTFTIDNSHIEKYPHTIVSIEADDLGVARSKPIDK